MPFLQDLPKPFFVLAPMDDVTDTVFRRVIADCAPPDVYFTEFVNVDGLQSPGRKKLLPKLLFTDYEKPLIAQVWGKNPENYYKTARELVEMGFAGVDINMGCPAKPVVKNGCCSALIYNRGLTGEIIQAVREGVNSVSTDFPVSVKTRIGFNEIDLTWIEYLLQQKLNMLTIHGRTVKEMSKVPVHWEVFPEINKMRSALAPSTLLVGNGDILSRSAGNEIAKKYGLDGVMIGRGVFHDPFVFSKLGSNGESLSPWLNMTKNQKIDLYTSHVKLFAKVWENRQRKIYTLNKFCKIYIEGFPGAKELREKLMSAESSDELLDMLNTAKD